MEQKFVMVFVSLAWTRNKKRRNGCWILLCTGCTLDAQTVFHV